LKAPRTINNGPEMIYGDEAEIIKLKIQLHTTATL